MSSTARSGGAAVDDMSLAPVGPIQRRRRGSGRRNLDGPDTRAGQGPWSRRQMPARQRRQVCVSRREPVRACLLHAYRSSAGLDAGVTAWRLQLLRLQLSFRRQSETRPPAIARAFLAVCKTGDALLVETCTCCRAGIAVHACAAVRVGVSWGGRPPASRPRLVEHR